MLISKSIKSIFITPVLIIIAIASCSNSNNTKAIKPSAAILINTAMKSTVIKIDAKQLVEDYKKYYNASDMKYKNKIVQISGYFYSIKNSTLFPGYEVQIGTRPHYNSSQTGISAFFEISHKPELIHLQKGQLITAQCEVKGPAMEGQDVNVSDCSIME